MEEKDKLKKEKEYRIECLIRELMINPRVKRVIVVIEYKEK